MDPDLPYMKQAILDLSEKLMATEKRCEALEKRADHAERELKRLRTQRLHNRILMGNVNGPGNSPQAAPATPRQLDES